MINEDKMIYDQFFGMLSSPNDIINPEEIFPLITAYAECRRKEMGVEKSLHLFLKYPNTETVGNGFRITAKRYNPILKSSYDGTEWNCFTEAFVNSEGIYVDFRAVDNFNSTSINGLWKVKNIIDFIHFLEHELMHEVQSQIFYEGQATKQNMKYLKDNLTIGIFDSHTNVQEQFFYHNAHNELFFEEEVNNHAKEYITEKIEEYKLSEVPSFGNYTVIGLIEKRIDESAKKNQPFSFDFCRPTLNGDEINEKFNTIPENIVSYLMDYKVLINPDLISNYPMLLIEYNEDGTRKTYNEIAEWRSSLFSIPGIIINGVKTEREDLFELCDSIIDSSPLLKLQELEQQLGRNLYDANPENKETVFLKDIDTITQMIETENFYPDNVLIYLNKRDSEINDKYSPALRECYRRVFESVKEKLQTKMLNLPSAKEYTGEKKMC